MMNAVVKPYHEMCLNSSELIVPRDTYQRALHPARVARIAKEFDERVANEPKISFRDGHYYVMDGQNTIAARKFLNGGEDLQIRCKVYFGMTEREEALLFAQQTGISERLSAGQKLRALIFAGEPAAVAFQQATELAGVHLSFEEGRGKQRISCIATAYHEFIRLGPELYIESLDVLLNAWNGEPDSMSSANLLGICRFVELYHSEYNKGRLIAKLRQVDPWNGQRQDNGEDQRTYLFLRQSPHRISWRAFQNPGCHPYQFPHWWHPDSVPAAVSRIAFREPPYLWFLFSP